MNERKTPIVGIDLGTTNSLVCVMQAGEPVLIPNGADEVLTMSAVSVDTEGHVLVGPDARARLSTHPDVTAVTFKRDMGTGRTRALGGKDWRPEELSAAVLGALKSDAEAFLGMPVEEAVITVPAYFGDLQRQATRAAARIAGLRADRIINEPTAAALAFGLHNLDHEATAVVLDLGGGTFDVTVLEIIEGVIEIQSTSGDAQLGGEDFSEALREWVLGRLEADGVARESLTETSLARVFEACERAKRRLSTSEEAAVVVPGLTLVGAEPLPLSLTVTRSELEAAFAPLLRRLRGPIQRALRDASRRPEDIEEVLLVGGATRMPCIVSLAAELFGRAPRTDLPADHAVAMGAAIQGALKAGDESVEDLVVTDVAPFTLGISSVSTLGTRMVEGVFSPILERGTVIPASRVEQFFTVTERQTEIVVEVFQGEHANCADNTFLGKYKVPKIPADKAGKQGIDVRFTYDLNGVLEVETTVQATGTKKQLVIERNPGSLSTAQIDAAQRAMAKLKFHPRDTLPNRTALARADALFVELTGEQRQMFGHAISQFRAALETQDPNAIDACRDDLVALTSRFKS